MQRARKPITFLLALAAVAWSACAYSDGCAMDSAFESAFESAFCEPDAPAVEETLEQIYYGEDINGYPHLTLGLTGPGSAKNVHDEWTSRRWYPGYSAHALDSAPRYQDPGRACKDLINVRWPLQNYGRGEQNSYGYAHCKMSQEGCAEITVQQHIEVALWAGGMECWNKILVKDPVEWRYEWRYAGLVLIEDPVADADCLQIPSGDWLVLRAPQGRKDVYVALDFANIDSRTPEGLLAKVAIPDDNGLVYADGQFDSVHKLTGTGHSPDNGDTQYEVLTREHVELMMADPWLWTGRLNWVGFKAHDLPRSEEFLGAGCAFFNSP